jgi:arylsulfatase A-like enzyme
LPRSCAPVPRVLKENGYVTGGFGGRTMDESVVDWTLLAGPKAPELAAALLRNGIVALTG